MPAAEIRATAGIVAEITPACVALEEVTLKGAVTAPADEVFVAA